MFELYQCKIWVLNIMLTTKMVGGLMMFANFTSAASLSLGFGNISEFFSKNKSEKSLTTEELILFNQKIIRAVAFAILGFCLINLSDHSIEDILEAIHARQ